MLKILNFKNGDINFKNVSFAYYVDLDDSDRDYMEVGLGLPFIKFVDVSINYGMFDSETDFWAMNMVKDWGKWEVSLLIMEDAKQDQFMDNASLGLFYKF